MVTHSARVPVGVAAQLAVATNFILVEQGHREQVIFEVRFPQLTLGKGYCRCGPLQAVRRNGAACEKAVQFQLLFDELRFGRKGDLSFSLVRTRGGVALTRCAARSASLS